MNWLILACPDCGPGRLARAAVFDDSFFTNLAVILSPLVLMSAVCALLYRVGRPS